MTYLTNGNASGDVNANQDVQVKKQEIKKTKPWDRPDEIPRRSPPMEKELRVLGTRSDSFIHQSHTHTRTHTRTQIIYPSHHSNTPHKPQFTSKACVMSEQSPPGLFAARCASIAYFPSASSGLPAPRLHVLNCS